VRRLATLSALLLLFGTLSACYDTRSTRVQLSTPGSSLDCFATADRVVTDAGFAASTEVSGVNRFYSPRTPGTLALGWGIAVAIQGRSQTDHTGPCSFELEALSPDESCGMNCPLTPAPGGEFKDITQKMARLLDEAFRGKSPELTSR
jgi:hypothetical protein